MYNTENQSQSARHPLTQRQKSIWVADMRYPGMGLSTYAAELELNFALDLERFASAWLKTVAGYARMSSVVVTIDGEPWFVPHSGQHRDIAVNDFSSEPAPTAHYEASRSSFHARSLDASKQLWDAQLCRLGQHHYRVVLKAHHLIFDGWTYANFFDQLRRYYDGEAFSSAPEIDQVAEEKAWLRTDEATACANWWRTQRQRQAVSPTMFDRPLAPEGRSSTEIQLSMHPTTAAALETYATGLARPGVSLQFAIQAVLLSTLAICVRRLGGGSDALLGHAFHNRWGERSRHDLGMYTVTLPFSAGFEMTASFEDVVESALQGLQGAREHARYAPWLDSGSTTADLNYYNWPPQMQWSDGPGALTIVRARAQLVPVLFTVMRHVTRLEPDQQERVTLQLSLSTVDDCLSEPERNQIASSFMSLLHDACCTPRKTCGALELLDDATRNQLLQRFSGVARDSTLALQHQPFIHEHIEHQAQYNGDNTAIICDDDAISFRQLHLRSNQLARHLLTHHSLATGERVGVLISRTIEQAVAMLAIWKSAGVYVPIDPAWPSMRIDQVIGDTGFRVLITAAANDQAPFDFTGDLVHVGDPQTFGDTSEEVLLPAISPGQEAYVIYTSGSTGMPNGVVLRHRALNNLFSSANISYDMGPGDRALCIAPFTFDASIRHLFHPLRLGATVHLVTENKLHSVPSVGDLLQEWRITHLTVATSLLRLIPQRSYPALRVVSTGGEQTDMPLVRAWLRGERRYFNFYGPTETTIRATAAELYEDDDLVHIGRPIRGVRCYLLDERLNPVPAGVVGELFIGGAGVAKGYLNDPRLTAQKFPSIKLGGERQRLYRTGDLARFLPDGNIQYVGRVDGQVKINGIRVELGEIEATLSKHPAVNATQVVTNGAQGHISVLVAYLVPVATKALPAPTEFKAWLRSRLPDYMQPAAYVPMSEFPVTRHGKIDTSKLPPAQPHHFQSDSPAAKPSTATEHAIARIWCDVLELDELNADSDFFSVGGHSLMGMKIISRVNSAFAIELSLNEMFEHPTVRELAHFIDSAHANAPTATTNLLDQQRMPPSIKWLSDVQTLTTASPPLFIVHAMGGNVQGFRDFVQHMPPNQPVLGIQAKGFADDRQPHTNLPEMASYYVTALRKMQPMGPYYLGGISIGSLIAYEIAVQLERSGERVAFLFSGDSHFSEGSHINRFARVLSWVTQFFMTPRTAMALGRARLQRKKVQAARQERIAQLDSQFASQQQKIKAAHKTALRNYRPPQYEGRLTLFVSSQLSLARLRAHREFGNNALGWDRLARNGADIKVLPGNHDSMFYGENARIFGETLSHALADAIGAAD